MWRTGATIRCPDEYGKLVEQHERPLAAVHDEARVAELAGSLLAEHAPFGCAGLLHVCEAPRRPELFHSASCTSTILAAAAPTPGRARAVSVHREPASHPPTGRAIGVVVIHTMEIAERAGAAEICARWFANPASEVSAHYCVDADSVVQCVREDDIAWHARGGNANSIGIELAGYAGQKTLGWNDDYSRAVIERAAQADGRGLCAVRDPDSTSPRRRSRRGPARHHGPCRCQRGVPQERPLGSRPRLPLDAVPAASAQQRRRRARHAGLTRPRRAPRG